MFFGEFICLRLLGRVASRKPPAETDDREEEGLENTAGVIPQIWRKPGNIYTPITIGYSGRGNSKDQSAPEGPLAPSVRGREKRRNRGGQHRIEKTRRPDRNA